MKRIHKGSLAMADSRAPAARPLSPHLQIYRWTWTMAMSIFHRITGGALYFGTLLLAWWLIAAASGPKAYADIEWFMSTLIGRLILIGYTWALLHHMLGGIRHLIWDTLHGFGPQERERLAQGTMFGSIILTIVIWGIGYLVMGGTR
jgi:succinate dehydrogenase / fumarate reductase cytochrome b subunit